MSKTTFCQIFECISLKVLETGSLQIFANPWKFAGQLGPNFFLKMPFHFLGKISLPQTVQYTIKKLNGRYLDIAYALSVTAPCGLFLWKAVYLESLSKKFQRRRTNTFCLKVNIRNHILSLQGIME